MPFSQYVGRLWRSSTQVASREEHETAYSSGTTSLQWKLIVCAALLFPVLFETLDYTIVATAQVEISSYFNRLDLQSYVGSCYLLTSTVFLPVFASFADIFGRHWALQLALVFFMVGSAISTGAQNMGMMLAGRGIAGVGAAGLLIVVRVILADSPSLNETNVQTTIIWFLYGIGLGIGPVLGGVLSTVSIRWIFAINLPCAAIAMLLCFILLRKRTKGSQPPRHLLSTSQPYKETTVGKLLRVDWIGATLFVGGGILVLLALNWGPSSIWRSARVIASFVVGGLLFITCMLWQYYLHRNQSLPEAAGHRIISVDPIIPLEILKSFDVCAVTFASFTTGMVMLVMFYFVAIFMTIGSGLSAEKAGLQLLHFIPGIGGGSLLSILMIRRLRQPRHPVVLSGIVFCVALGLLSKAVDQNEHEEASGFLAMSGVGVGLSASSLALHARFSQPSDKVAAVSALVIFANTLGGTVGLAQCSAVMNSKATAYILSLAKSGQLSASSAAQLIAMGTSSVDDIDFLPQDVQDIFRAAFRSGTRWCFISLTPWCAVAFLLTLYLKDIVDTDNQPQSGENMEMSQPGRTDTGREDEMVEDANDSSRPKAETV